MVRASQCSQAFSPLVSPQVLHVVARNDSTFGVAHNVEALQSRTGTNAFEFVSDGGGEFGDGTRVESPQQSTEIKAEYAVAVIAESIFHDFPHVASLEKAVQEQHGFVKLRKVVPANDSIAAQIHASNAAQLAANHSWKAQGCHQRVVHDVFVSGYGPP